MTILQGDVRAVLPTLPADYFHCVVTSVPYWKLRNYLKADDPLKHLELGSEATIEEYVANQVAVFREVKRVLRDDGLVFLDIGDSYNSLTIAPHLYKMRDDLTDKEVANVAMAMFGVWIDRCEKKGQGPLSDVLCDQIQGRALQVGPALASKRIAEELQAPSRECIAANNRTATGIEMASDRGIGGQVCMLRRNAAGVFDSGSCEWRRSSTQEGVDREEPGQFDQNLPRNSASGVSERQVQDSLLQLQLFNRVLGVLSTHTFASHEIPDSIKAQFRPVGNLKSGDLCLIPARLALALQADGWIVRQIIVWHKPSPMPESVSGTRWERHRIKERVGNYIRQGKCEKGYVQTPQNEPDNAAVWSDCPGCPKCEPNGGLVLRRGSWRCTTAHEYVLMLAKSGGYWADQEAVKEQGIYTGMPERREYEGKWSNDGSVQGAFKIMNGSRNPRSVWTIPAEPFSGQHYAAFPSALPEKCIAVATSAKGCCPTCGACWARIVDQMILREKRPDKVLKYKNREWTGFMDGYRSVGAETTTLGWRPTCGCKLLRPKPDVPQPVLDMVRSLRYKREHA